MDPNDPSRLDAISTRWSLLAQAREAGATSADEARKALVLRYLPAIRRYVGAMLRGHDADLDSVAGRRLAQVLAWADVYLYSSIDPQVVEDLSMIPIDHPGDARRLLSRSSSCILVSHADRTRGTVREEETGERQDQ